MLDGDWSPSEALTTMTTILLPPEPEGQKVSLNRWSPGSIDLLSRVNGNDRPVSLLSRLPVSLPPHFDQRLFLCFC